MTTKTTLNAKSLEALGAARLAELLIDISSGNAAFKRRLRLALASARSCAPYLFVTDIRSEVVRQDHFEN